MNWRAYEMDMNIEKEEAREEGLTQGIALFQKLYAAGRTEDAEKAASDEAFREELFREFGMKS